MRSIVRKDTDGDWEEFLTRPPNAKGIENPIDNELRRFDSQRRNKTFPMNNGKAGSMATAHHQDEGRGRTQLSYKAEQSRQEHIQLLRL